MTPTHICPPLFFQLAQLTSDLKIAEAAYGDYKAEVERLRGVVGERDAKISELERKTGTLEAEHGHQSAAIEDLKRSLLEHQGRLQGAVDEVAQLTASATAKDEEIRGLLAKYEEANVKNSSKDQV